MSTKPCKKLCKQFVTWLILNLSMAITNSPGQNILTEGVEQSEKI